MEIRYFDSYDSEFTTARDQEKVIDKDYDYLRKKFFQRLFSAVTYPFFVLFGCIYTRFVLKIRVEGEEKLKGRKEPYFVFSNHTQPIGDAFLIPRIVYPRRVNVMMSPANLSIPVIGRLLPYLGGMPLPGSLKGLIAFNSAFESRAKKRVSVIFPEAHVWEYCEEIRPFKEAAFTYPVKLSQPSFALTLTYQKSKRGRRPKATAYIEGPFYPDASLSLRKGAAKLCEEVTDAMRQRAKCSNAGYIIYLPRE